MKPIIRRAEFVDVQSLVPRLRTEDQRELEELHPNENLINLIWDGCVRSYQAMAMVFPDQYDPCLLFGVRDYLLEVDGGLCLYGAPWLLANHSIKGRGISIARELRHWVQAWTYRYEHLSHYADSRNKTHLEWIKFMGFTLGDPPWPEQNGVKLVPFYY